MFRHVWVYEYTIMGDIQYADFNTIIIVIYT